jgi:diacylglycerol kinase family enzyme
MTTALPSRPADALDAAPRGTARRVDLGRIEGDSPAAIHFAAMSGAGLDAAMLQPADALTPGRHLPRRSDLAP